MAVCWKIPPNTTHKGGIYPPLTQVVVTLGLFFPMQPISHAEFNPCMTKTTQKGCHLHKKNHHIATDKIILPAHYVGLLS